MEGRLEEFEKDEHERFEQYLDKFIDDSLEETDTCPVEF
jgi:hypothetical protein